MPSRTDNIDPKAVLTVQINMLEMALKEHEQSWQAIGFATIPNPIAERLRQDIVEKKALLALNQPAASSPAETPAAPVPE